MVNLNLFEVIVVVTSYVDGVAVDSFKKTIFYVTPGKVPYAGQLERFLGLYDSSTFSVVSIKKMSGSVLFEEG